MKINKTILFIFALAFSNVIHINSYSHPGRTDSNGCHTCRINCSRWGIPYGFYHRHNPFRTCFTKEKITPKRTYQSDICEVTTVIDGDTIKCKIINGKQETIRLIGVDTPETKHPNKPVEYFGKEASKFTKNLVEGKLVKLEYDWQRKDRYGRTLAYVYLEDGTFVNAEIIKQGYGFAYTKFPFKYFDQFRLYEQQARKNKKGLWK